MEAMSFDQEARTCAVVRVRDQLPTWECSALTECMTRDEDWHVMQARQDAVRGEGFSWVEATNGRWTKVTKIKSSNAEERPTRMEMCLGHWRGVARALERSAGR